MRKLPKKNFFENVEISILEGRKLGSCEKYEFWNFYSFPKNYKRRKIHTFFMITLSKIPISLFSKKKSFDLFICNFFYYEDLFVKIIERKNKIFMEFR